jgi:hypothetical protein
MHYFENNLGSLRVSIASASISCYIEEKVEDVKGDRKITNLKSLNRIEMEEWGGPTKEDNFVFTHAWTLLKSKGLIRGKEQGRRQIWLNVIYITVFHQ